MIKVPVGNNKGAAANNETANLAVVAQSFDQEDQIQDLNISGPKNAHLAQTSEISEETVEEDPEEEMMELQFAFIVSTTPEPKKKEVSQISCS